MFTGTLGRMLLYGLLLGVFVTAVAGALLGVTVEEPGASTLSQVIRVSVGLVYPVGVALGVVLGFLDALLMLILARAFRLATYVPSGYRTICAFLCAGVNSLLVGALLFILFLWTPYLAIPIMALFILASWFVTWRVASWQVCRSRSPETRSA